MDKKYLNKIWFSKDAAIDLLNGSEESDISELFIFSETKEGIDYWSKYMGLSISEFAKEDINKIKKMVLVAEKTGYKESTLPSF